MDFEKLKQWMELAQKYQTGDFWSNMLNQSSFSQFMNDNMGPDPSNSENTPPPNQNKQHTQNTSFPNIDIYMTDADVIVVAELAGYEKENIHISVSGNKLLLKGTSTPVVFGHAVQQERYEGQFQRIDELPEPTSSNQIKAKLDNGLLTLSYNPKYFQEERVSIDYYANPDLPQFIQRPYCRHYVHHIFSPHDYAHNYPNVILELPQMRTIYIETFAGDDMNTVLLS